MTPDDGTGGPLDVNTLRTMARRARSHDLVVQWRFRPDTISPRVLELQLDVERYPDAIEAVRVDVRWFEDGTYTIHYLETGPDHEWQCRWDRHPKPEAPEAHFHPPPAAGPAIEPSPVDAAHPLGVLFGVLEWLGDRLNRLYEGG